MRDSFVWLASKIKVDSFKGGKSSCTHNVWKSQSFYEVSIKFSFAPIMTFGHNFWILVVVKAALALPTFTKNRKIWKYGFDSSGKEAILPLKKQRFENINTFCKI